MPIESDAPTTVPTREYTQWWLRSFTVMAPSPNGQVRVSAAFVKTTAPDGDGVRHELPGSERTHQVDDLFALAATDPAIAALVDGIISTVGALAKQAGKID